MTLMAAILNNNNKKKIIKNSIWLLFSKIKFNWMIQFLFISVQITTTATIFLTDWLGWAGFTETVYSHYLFILQCFVFFSRKLTNFLKIYISSDSSIFHKNNFVCKYAIFNIDLYRVIHFVVWKVWDKNSTSVKSSYIKKQFPNSENFWFC